jgi:hypothetical protein
MRKHHINGQNPIQRLAGIQWEPTRNGRNREDNNDDDDGRNDKSSVQNINKSKRENQEDDDDDDDDDDDTRFFFTFCKKSAGVLVVVAAVVVSVSTKLLWTVLFTRWSGSQLDSLTLVQSFLHPCCDELLLLTTMLFSPPTSTFFMVVAVEGLDGFTEKMGRWVEPLEETRKVWRAESNPLVASLKEGDFIKLSHSLSIVARRSINDCTLDFMSFISDSAIF